MKKTKSAASGTGISAVRPQVRQLLEQSPAYRSLPPEKRRQIAQNMVRVASYLVDPNRLVSQEFARPVLAPNDLVTATNFPAFVSGLIEGVFGAVVNASVQQMEVYAKLIAHAASSVSDFAADTITPEMARTHLVTTFPHVLGKSSKGALRLTPEAPLHRSTLAHVARTLGLRRPLPGAATADTLRGLVTAARRRVARERQKSLALALSMGINRIVVTNGRISARSGR